MSLGTKYVEVLLQIESKVLKDVATQAFKDGHDLACRFLMTIATDLDRQVELMQMVERTSLRLAEEYKDSTTAEVLERKRQMYKGEW